MAEIDHTLFSQLRGVDGARILDDALNYNVSRQVLRERRRGFKKLLENDQRNERIRRRIRDLADIGPDGRPRFNYEALPVVLAEEGDIEGLLPAVKEVNDVEQARLKARGERTETDAKARKEEAAADKAEQENITALLQQFDQNNPQQNQFIFDSVRGRFSPEVLKRGLGQFADKLPETPEEWRQFNNFITTATEERRRQEYVEGREAQYAAIEATRTNRENLNVDRERTAARLDASGQMKLFEDFEARPLVKAYRSELVASDQLMDAMTGVRRNGTVAPGYSETFVDNQIRLRYGRMNEPSSAVMIGEYAAQVGDRSLADKLGAVFRKVVGGGPLSAGERQTILKFAEWTQQRAVQGLQDDAARWKKTVQGNYPEHTARGDYDDPHNLEVNNPAKLADTLSPAQKKIFFDYVNSVMQSSQEEVPAWVWRRARFEALKAR